MFRKIKQAIGRKVRNIAPVSKRTFKALRFEANATIAGLISFFHPKYRRRVDKIRSRDGINVNVGCGGNTPNDWVNIDAAWHTDDLTLVYDIRNEMPFRDGQVSRIFAEHVIEHIEYREGLAQFVLNEFYRVLEDGGRVRIVVPDGERWLEAYVTNDPEKWKSLGLDELPDDMPTKMSMINHVFHQDGEHKFLYDFKTLKHHLKKAGFRDVSKMSYDESQDDKLCLDDESHAPYSLYVEATK